MLSRLALPATVLLLALSPLSALAEEPEPKPADAALLASLMRTLRAARRAGPIKLDGRPDEAAWKSAEVADHFTQTQPDEGQPATVATRVRVLWDDHYLYLAAECDDPEPPTDNLSRRDRFVEGDWISFDFDTTFDRRTAYHFQVYAGGHIVDGLHFNDTEFTLDWDTAWEAEVASSPKGWTMEAKIPLRALRIPLNAKEFGFNVFRRLSRRGEESQWRFAPKGTPGDTSLLGTLTGIEGIKPVSELELRPYVAARITRTWPPPGPAAHSDFGLCTSNGLAPQTIVAGCAGVDLRYNLSSDLSLVATINPDFGQVEADALTLNLTTFELFFPEKRPFFLEGLDLFRVPLQVNFGGPYGGNAYQLFYSRRIGRATPDPDALVDTDTVLYKPTAVPVAVAAKMSGTVGPLSLGVLSALEPRTFAQILHEDGTQEDERAREATYTGALRLRLAAGHHFLTGLSITAVDPLYAPGARHAHTSALDFTLFDDDKVWTFGGQLAGSLINGGLRSTLRDGTIIDPSGLGSFGSAASLLLQRNGEHFQLMVAADILSNQFDTNDLGFQRRGNLQRAVAIATLRNPHPNSWHQYAQIDAWTREVRDHTGRLLLARDQGFEYYAQFNNFWGTGGGIYYMWKHVDDRELDDGTPIERTDLLGGYMFFETDRRQKFSMDANLTLTQYFKSPGWETDGGLNFSWRPISALELTLNNGWSYDTGELRAIRDATQLPESGADPTIALDPEFATQELRQYLLADQTSHVFTSTLRATWAFSPKLTLQAYAQLFTATVVYGAPKRAVVQAGKPTVRYSDLVAARPEDQAPLADDGEAGLNVNVILRWEWRLGSTLYLVYARQTSGSYLPRRTGFDGGLGSLDTSNGGQRGDTLLVKVDLLGAL